MSGRRRRQGVLASRAGQVAAAVSATIATLAALVGVLDYVDKQVDPEIPAKVSQIHGVELRDTAQPLRDYVQEVRPTDGRAYTSEELQRRGYTFLVALSAEEPEGTHLRLRWVLYAADGSRVPGSDYAQVSADFTTSASRQERAWPVWVPFPPRDGRYRVRFMLEDDQQRPLDQAQSAPFVYRGG